MAPTEPARAQALATEVLQSADGNDVAVIAERALGLAYLEQHDIVHARAHLERSLALAKERGLRTMAALAQKNLSLALASAGETHDALAHADGAAVVLRGAEAARLHAQRAVILQRLGRTEDALLGYRRALAGMRRAGDLEGEARVLANRGLLRAYSGRYRDAEDDLRRAEQRFLELDMRLPAAQVRHNLGFVASRQGDVPSALALYDRADGEAGDHRRAVRLLDRFETLMSVRLMDEARLVGHAAAADLEARGMEVDLAEARVLLAQAAVIAGDGAEGKRLALLAHDAFVAQLRPGWAALASFAGLRAAWALGERTTDLLETARRTAAELEGSGWAALALDARLIAAQLGMALHPHAKADLKALESARLRPSDPVDLRARLLHGRALLRLAHGDRRGADAALRAGLRLLNEHQASLGATELRVHAAVRAQDLASAGLDLALLSGRAPRVFAWAERWRAGALRNRPVRAPSDHRLAALLADLRRAAGELEQAAFAGAPTGDSRRRQAAIEAAISRRARQAPGRTAGDGVEPPRTREVHAALGDRALVEFVEHDGRLYAVRLLAGKTSLHELGPSKELRTEVEAVAFALERLARGLSSEVARGAAADALEDGARRLDALLLAPIARPLGDRAVVLVPTGDLHALPWATLPTLRGRPFTVSPSAALWLRASGRLRRRPAARTVLVGGPDLPEAAGEIADLAVIYPRAERFDGSQATVAAVARALEGAGLAHVAAHGTFRADNPLFSSLRLRDGPLTVYDLEGLARPPRRVVLSACSSALTLTRPGDELMGLSAAFLSLGTETLVASILPVPDTIARSLAVDLHRRLATGVAPSAALVALQVASSGPTDPGAAAARGMVCFGAG